MSRILPPDPSGDPNASPASGVSRRAFLQSASAATVVAGATSTPNVSPQGASADSKTYAKGTHEIVLKINGQERRVRVEPRTTLLDALRESAELTGTKKICDRGACGGCTVRVDGEIANACMMLAFDAVDHELQTIEGVANGDTLHPLQSEFVACDALQCGFCTPGMVMSGLACIERRGQPTAEQIRADLSGNICRCGTYGRVFEAVENAAVKMNAKPARRSGQGGVIR